MKEDPRAATAARLLIIKEKMIYEELEQKVEETMELELYIECFSSEMMQVMTIYKKLAKN